MLGSRMAHLLGRRMAPLVDRIVAALAGIGRIDLGNIEEGSLGLGMRAVESRMVPLELLFELCRLWPLRPGEIREPLPW